MRKIYYFKTKHIFLSMIFAAIIFSSCTKDDPENRRNGTSLEKPIKAINSIMNDYYLWNDKVPVVNADNYDDPVALLDDLRYKELDKWSYIANYTTHQQWYNSGQYAGLGVGFGFHTDNTVRIMYVFDDSPLKEKGVKRGWVLNKVNGSIIIPGQTNVNELLGPNEEGISVTLEFKTPEGDTKQFTVQKKIITTNSVLHADTIDLGSKVVGHMVYNSFIHPSIKEINSAFALFKEVGISDLIVDLRYNGGGDLNVAQHLGSMIVGEKGNDKIYYRFAHNSKIASELDAANRFDNLPEALDVDRVIFITSKNSASASEVLINGLEPHMEVMVVGDKTHGKPVGMYGFEEMFKDYNMIFVPVCFQLVNSNGEGDYFDGIPVDYPATDDLTRDFPDRNEAGLKQALSIVQENSVPVKSAVEQPGYPKREGLEFEIGAY